MEKKKVRIAVAQLDVKTADKHENISKAVRELDRLARDSVDIVCFPELWNTGYSLRERFYEVSEPIPGPTTQRLGEKAKEHEMYIIAGIDEAGKTPGSIYNSACFLGPNGRLIGVYRKVHLVSERERSYFTPGREYPIFKTPLGNVAIMICYDMGYFPEVARIYALKGAEIIFCPSAWGPWFPEGRIDWAMIEQNRVRFEATQRARATENVVFVATANRVGEEYDELKNETCKFIGHSGIIDPAGQPMAQLGDSPASAAKEIDLGEVFNLRKTRSFNPLKDRRPETYSLLSRRDLES